MTYFINIVDLYRRKLCDGQNILAYILPINDSFCIRDKTVRNKTDICDS